VIFNARDRIKTSDCCRLLTEWYFDLELLFYRLAKGYSLQGLGKHRELTIKFLHILKTPERL